MESTYVLRWTAATARTAVRVLETRTRPVVSLRICSPLIGMETILVLVWEIILGELVHHLGICSRLIIATHLIGPAEVSIATAHSIPPIAIAATILHHVHGGHVVHAHAHVSTIVAVHAIGHAVHVVEI